MVYSLIDALSVGVNLLVAAVLLAARDRFLGPYRWLKAVSGAAAALLFAFHTLAGPILSQQLEVGVILASAIAVLVFAFTVFWSFLDAWREERERESARHR